MSQTEIDAKILVNATMGFAELATGFVTEPETWPVFHAWAVSQGLNPDTTREAMLTLKAEVQYAAEIFRRLGEMGI